jgi:hypothetical protein
MDQQGNCCQIPQQLPYRRIGRVIRSWREMSLYATSTISVTVAGLLPVSLMQPSKFAINVRFNYKNIQAQGQELRVSPLQLQCTRC